ncbi:hypothetical protein K469DRAFT_717468, partial [Zopfia rhizophila CBS 207.26]
MNGLRWFLRDQVDEAQAQLHDLLLLPEGDLETRGLEVPSLRLTDLKDDPTVTTAGWSFLQDPRNACILNGRTRWLLNRIRVSKRLKRRFFVDVDRLEWDRRRVSTYIGLAYVFLRRLLLLVHITGG